MSSKKSLRLAWNAHPPGREQRLEIIDTIAKITEEKNIPIDALCNALEIPRATYYRHHCVDNTSAIYAPKPPKNALSNEEKQQVLDLLHCEHYVDKTPYQIFNKLIDDGKYYCSPRTMYRMLEKQGENRERRLLRNHRDAIKPELIATRPNEVWSWDISVPQKAV